MFKTDIMPYAAPNSPAVAVNGRPSVRGKFVFVGEEKFYVRGVTYGTFRPNERGEEFPAPEVVENSWSSAVAGTVPDAHAVDPPKPSMLCLTSVQFTVADDISTRLSSNSKNGRSIEARCSCFMWCISSGDNFHDLGRILMSAAARNACRR